MRQTSEDRSASCDRRKGEPSKAGGGRTPRVKEDRVDPFIRSLVGWRANREERLLVKLLEAGKEVPISGLSPGDAKLIPKLKKHGVVEIAAHDVRLTELGATIARGAKKLYPEFWD